MEPDVEKNWGRREGAAGVLSLLSFLFVYEVYLKPLSCTLFRFGGLFLFRMGFLDDIVKLTWSDASFGTLRADVTFTSCYRLQLTHSVRC